MRVYRFQGHFGHVIACGHSARQAYEQLEKAGIEMLVTDIKLLHETNEFFPKVLATVSYPIKTPVKTKRK